MTDDYNPTRFNQHKLSFHSPKTMSLSDQLNGVLIPPTTSFSINEEFDEAQFLANLKQWSATGISGFVVLGSTGERVHLDERDYQRVLNTARNVIQRSHAFIVGVGQQSTLGTLKEVAIAAEAGADAVLVLTPYFYRSALTNHALVEFFTRVADASKVPVMLYSMPALTGIKIEPATIARLSEHENIVGVKDSSNDIAGFAETVKLCPPDFAVMTGNGTVLLDALKAGATGGILAVGCAVPEVCLKVFRNFREGRLVEAEALQAKLTPLAAAVTTRFGIGGLKAAMDLAGYPGGNVRSPLSIPADSERAEISELLESVLMSAARP